MSFRSIEAALAGITIGSISLAGCGDANNSKDNIQPPAVTRPVPTPVVGEPRLTPPLNIFPPEVLENYPEFKSETYKIKAGHNIETPTGKETQLFNLTDYTVNLEAVTAIYQYLENYLENVRPIRLAFLDKSGETIQTSTYNLFEKRSTVILPDTFPVPKDVLSQYGQTKWQDNSRYGSTFLRLGNFISRTDRSLSVQEGYTLLFAVEACQQSLIGFVVDKNGKLIEDRNRTLQAQEIICNMIGYAIGRKVHGDTYEEYVKWMNTCPPIMIPGRNLITIIPALDKDRYDAIPNLETILK